MSCISYISFFIAFILSNVKSRSLVEETSKSSSKVDLDNFLVPKKKIQDKPKCNIVRSVTDNSHIAYRTRSKVLKIDDCMVIELSRLVENRHAKPKRNAASSLTYTADVVGRKCSKVKKLKADAVFEFIKTAENRPVNFMYDFIP